MKINKTFKKDLNISGGHPPNTSRDHSQDEAGERDFVNIMFISK